MDEHRDAATPAGGNATIIDKAAPTTDAWAPCLPTAIESDESDAEYGPQERLTGQLRRAVTLAPPRER